MREILSRGKRKDNGEWVEGTYLHLNLGRDFICDGTVWIGTLQPCKYEVITETIGQFTGLTDKNGKKIFEGDIVKMSFEGISREYNDEIFGSCDEVDFDGHKIGVVTFGGYGTFLKVSCGELYINGEIVETWKPARKSRLAAYRSEVIGNIHDNPELLEE